MFRCVCVIEGSKNQNRWPHLGNLSIMFLDLLWNYIVLMFAFADPLFSLSILVFPATQTHARALILMDITMICPILYSVRFVSTVIISKRFWRRIIFYDFSLYSVSLRKWWSSRETSACILWHCVYVIKQYKKYLDWMVSCLSVCFIFFYYQLHFLYICQLLQTTNKQHVQFMTFPRINSNDRDVFSLTGLFVLLWKSAAVSLCCCRAQLQSETRWKIHSISV